MNNGAGNNRGRRKEVWDGERFAELAWFWDPHCEWILPTRCPLCSGVISSTIIDGSVGCITLIKCPQCHNKFQHCVESANGDPRKIALIGHWDGWLPFSGSVKHTSGQCSMKTSMQSILKSCRHYRCYRCFNSNYG